MHSFIKRHQVILTATLLCLFSLHIVSTNTKGSGGEILVKGVIKFSARPFQAAFLSIRSTMAGLWEDHIYLMGLKQENRELAGKIDDLSSENTRLKEELSLSVRLKELLTFKEASPFETVAASILGFSSLAGGSSWTRVSVLNKGSADGIEKDMPIICASGIVGRVIEVTDSTSTALLLTDPRSNIDVILQRTRVSGVAEGDGKGLSIKYVRELEDVQVGDRVVTAGLSGIFPKGLPAGEVTRVEKGWDNFFKSIKVRPTADLEKLEEVLIIISGLSPHTQGEPTLTGEVPAP